MPPARDATPRLRHRLEYLLVRAFVRTVEALPERAADALADGVTSLMHAVLPGRVRIARTQMGAALGLDPASPEVVAAVRTSFGLFIQNSLRLIRLPQMLLTRRAEEILVVEGMERLSAARAGGRGVVFVTAHLGNWEVLGTLVPKLGVPLVSVTRAIGNPLLETEMRRMREGYGQRIVWKEEGGLRLARVLKQGGIVALMIDQHAGSRGVRIPFFHADASTFTFAAALARRFDAAFVTGFTHVEEPFRIRLRIEPEIPCDRSLPEDEDAFRMTLEFHRRLEAAIRAEPGQYLWIHRRWKPGGQEPDPGWRERYAPAR